MENKRKVILGASLLAIGIVLLVLGLIEYINTTGFNALTYPNVHQYVTARAISLLGLGWGIGLLGTGIFIMVLGIINHKFTSKKPLAVAITILIIGLAFTGILGYIAIPPSAGIKASMAIESHYTEMCASSADFSNISIQSNYPGTYYLNSTSTVLSSGDLGLLSQYSEVEYQNLSVDLSDSFSTPGNHSLNLTVISHNSKKIYNSWVYVYPQITASFTGPANVNDQNGPVTATYVSSYTGFTPDNYTWSVLNEIFGDVQELSYNKYSRNLSIDFYQQSNSYNYGYNGTIYISLTVTTSYGDSYTYSPNFLGYQVSVTGN